MSLKNKAKEKLKSKAKNKLKKVAFSVIKPFLPYIIIFLVLLFAICTYIIFYAFSLNLFIHLILMFVFCCCSVQLLSHVRPFETPWTAAHLASLTFTISQSLLKIMSIESVMPSNNLIFCCPLLLLLQSLPASESLPMSQLFASVGQRIEASALSSVPPMNIQA